MNKKIPLIAIIGLLLLGIGQATNYTRFYCQDNSTLVEEHYYNEGSGNITTEKIFTNPRFGCENGAAVTLDQDMMFGGIAIAALIAFVALNLGMAYFFPRGEFQGIKILLFFVSIGGLWYLLSNISLIAQEYTNIYIFEKLYESISALSGVYMWIIFFLSVLFFLYYVIGSLGYLQGEAERYGRSKKRKDKRP